MKQINLNAPVKCCREITINASKEKIWTILGNINAWSAWNPAITRASLKEELRAGAVFEWKTGGVSIRSTLHTVQPYMTLGWSGRAPGVYAIHNWNLSSSGQKTKVTVEESMEGILVRMFKRSFSTGLESGMERWLQLLKEHCEE